MSAFGGIFFFDKDRSLEPSALIGMDKSLENSGRDGSRTRLAGSVGFIYRPFHTTSESRREQQPLEFRGMLLTFDGRIDNREELAREFGVENRTDADLFALSYEKWGNACFSKVLGDFAAAIWNSESRNLVLVRDPFGVKKVFYFRDSEKILWATDITALLNHRDVPETLDENFVGMSLAYLPEGDTSPFKHIKPVTPGHYVILDSQRDVSTEYWGLSFCLRKTSDNRNVLEEELRCLLSQSLRACLRSEKPVTAELSGGLDSSTIVCFANKFLEDIGQRDGHLHTLSHVYNKARQSDERSFIEIVEEQIGRPGFHLLEDDDPILSRWPDAEFTSYPNRVHCFGGAVDAVHKSMKSVDSRVLLSGSFGDQLFVSGHVLPYEAVDLVREGKLLEAFATCRKWSTKKRQPLLQVMWHGAIRPNLPFWLRRVQTHSIQGPPTTTASFRIPAWIRPQFIAQTNLKSRIHCLVDRDADFNAGSRGIRYANLMQAVGWFGSGYNQNQTSREQIEMRYPYLYRPLVEFLISLPYREHCNEKTARSLQRAVARGVVPQKVRARTDKRGPHEAILIAASKEQKFILSLIKDSRACHQGFTVQSELLKEADRWRNGQSTSDMLKFIALEMWLRALENRN